MSSRRGCEKPDEKVTEHDGKAAGTSSHSRHLKDHKREHKEEVSSSRKKSHRSRHNLDYRRYIEFKALYNKEVVPVLLNFKQQQLDFRKNSLTFLRKVHRKYGYRHKTYYLSVHYLDIFISGNATGKEDQTWFNKAAVGCISIAAKVNFEKNLEKKLREYTLDVSTKHFQRDELEDIELEVAKALKWVLFAIVPYEYVYFYTMKFEAEGSERAIKNLLELIMFEVDIMHGYRPSILAGAATLVAMKKEIPRESLQSMIQSIPDFRGSDILDPLFTCYTQLKERIESA